MVRPGRRARRIIASVASLTVALLLLGGCGGGGDPHQPATNTHADGLVTVRSVTYRSPVDGTRVTGLLAAPRGVASRGCVIWQFGLGSKKEDSAGVWQGLATLGLSTFSIDFRDHGARASGANQYQKAILNATAFAKLIRGTVGDLHGAVGYLERQPLCAHNVAYAGVSLGGVMGTILAGTDKRVKAVALIVTPGTFRASLTTPGEPILPAARHDRAQLAADLRILSPLDPARFIGKIAPRPVLVLSGLKDQTVVFSNARILQEAARHPKTIVDYPGGHNPALGPGTEGNDQVVASFLLRTLVEPAFGISGSKIGTFLQQ